MTATIEKSLIDIIREDYSTIIQFFKDSNTLITGVCNLFGNNNEDFTYQLYEGYQDDQVDAI